MRLLKNTLVLVLLFAGSLLGGTLVQIRVAHANARAEPDSAAEIVAVLTQGQTLPVVDDVPYWYEVTLSDGQMAYVAKSLCKVVLEEAGENTEERQDSRSANSSTACPRPALPLCFRAARR